ncbi:BspA family leucine-rich repeat surface protein [Bifidobacterium sp. ESL0763]|uniref:BspA family leucine-rich repeat surface protein n=1 Tax=Bifidobacterium sp. ESL0763 TaxID=2983227 RepID=UPI0023F8F1F4|nr:BspA family leucine-rich repeat surface protein [Bifidobacterium sp. ESL0763]MDF7664468.1 BspA family leucine-rich repeat surface protein [Bifidobacterium sp. ESL0763]
MTAGKKIPKILGSVAALAMLCGAVTVSATAANENVGPSQPTAAQETEAQKQDANNNNKDNKAGDKTAKDEAKPAAKDGAKNQSKQDAATTKSAPQAQPGDSPLLGQRPTKPTAKITQQGGKAFKIDIADGSQLDLHNDGSYTYRSFDGTVTSVSPKYVGSYNFVYLQTDPVTSINYYTDNDSVSGIREMKFSSPHGLVKEIGLYWDEYRVDRNDGWHDTISPIYKMGKPAKWGDASAIKDVAQPSDRYEPEKDVYFYEIGAGHVGSAGDAPWLSHAFYDVTLTADSTVTFTDPEHTVLPADCSKMFADVKYPGVFDVNQIGKLDTSNVTNMHDMFNENVSITGTGAFSGWDTSKVTDMSGMFWKTQISDISALSHWDLRKVTTMSGMFLGDDDLQSVDAKDLKLDSLTAMDRMFSEDAHIKDVSAIGTWDTSHVTTMNRLFAGAKGISNELPSSESLTELTGVDKIDMSAVTDASEMFAYNQNLKSIGGIEGLQVANVEDMSSMFVNDWALTALDLHSWNTKNAKNMDAMFAMAMRGFSGSGLANAWKNMNSQLTSINVTGWDTSKAPSLSYMFSGCVKLTNLEGVSEWDTASVRDASDVFANCRKLSTLDLSRWNVSNMSDISDMFQNFGQDVSNAADVVDLSSIEGWQFSKSSDVTVYGLFDGCAAKTLPVAGWDTSQFTSGVYMFRNMPNLTTVDVSKWDTGNMGDTGGTFENDPKLESVDISNWKTSKNWGAEEMFKGDTSLTSVGSLAHKPGSQVWDTHNFLNTQSMFQDCPKLKSLDLSGWDLGDVTSDYYHVVVTHPDGGGTTTTYHSDHGIDYMFSGDTGLESINLSGWNIQKVSKSKNVFTNNSSLKSLDLSNWDAHSLDSFDGTFDGAGSSDGMKLDLSNWKVNDKVSVEMSLRQANVAELDLTGWDTTANTGFQPRFSADLRQLTVGPKTVLRPEYFVTGAEPGGSTRDAGSYTGQWAEASNKADAKQTCTVDGTTYTAHGEAWTSCGRTAGTSATASMMDHANANKQEATYVWEQSSLAHFAGLDATKPKAPYDDSVMAPQQLHGVDALGVKVDGSEKPVDVRGLVVALPAQLHADGYTNVGWLRDGDPASAMSDPGTQMAVPAGEQVVRAMWSVNPITPPVSPVPGQSGQPNQPSNPNGPGALGGNSGRPLYLNGQSGANGLLGAAGNGKDSLAGKHAKSKSAQSNKKPLCLPGYTLTSAYVLDDAGYVVPSAERCVPKDASSTVTVNAHHAAFPWWIVLLAAVALIGYYCYADRDRFVYAQHRSDENSDR